ncbi:YcxB family protein [Streptomyces sp. NPDC001770]
MDTRGGAASQPEAERGTAAVAEFVYRLTADDFEQALRGRARWSWAGRVQVLLLPVVTTVAFTVFSFLRGSSLPVAIVTTVVADVAVIWGTLRGLRSTARRIASVMEPYGECRTVADESGTVSTGERGAFSMEWSVYREYLETPGLFVVLGGDRATGIGVLPKRGAQDPADVDRLREILDRNLKRLQRLPKSPDTDGPWRR